MIQPSLPQGYTDAELLHERLMSRPEGEWYSSGAQRAIQQFHDMAEGVPAYKDFLQKQNFKVASVQTVADFTKVPMINKDNYLRAYPRADLCWGGTFKNQSWVISTTSGSTGQPFYFPRVDLQDEYLTITTELYLRSNFGVQSRSTLYIDAFPMGAWIGGVYTYESIKRVAEKGYNLSIITPGIHKQEVINAVKQLGHDFDQIIIGAYAPFLKDILDDGIRQGVEWQDYKIGFVFSAEAFSEKFRDYVLDTIGSKDALRTTLNHYGTVDLGTMAHETPESIMIRRMLQENKQMGLLFPEAHRQPTFAQYNPEMFFFEEVDHNLVCTSYSGLPLMRYELKDYGGVLQRSDVHETLRANDVDVDTEADKAGIADTLWNLPFVYVYERNDFSVSYYAFLIYPDTVRRALQHEALHRKITGKFSMQVDYDTQGRQRLHIHVETKHGIAHDAALNTEIQKAVHETLVDESSEYRETNRMVGDDAQPIIYLWEYEDPTHFRAGTKQKWTIK